MIVPVTPEGGVAAAVAGTNTSATATSTAARILDIVEFLSRPVLVRKLTNLDTAARRQHPIDLLGGIRMGKPDQPRDAKGRWTKGGGGVLVAGAIAVAAANGVGTGAGLGGTAGEAVGSANISAARVAQSKQAARKGRSDDAWRGLNLRRVRHLAEPAVNCAVNSYGQVRDFFLRNPCKSLDRTLFTLADPGGSTFVVSVSWVRMRQQGDVRRLKDLIDVDGTGSVTQLGAAALKAQGVHFTGTPFRSRPQRDLLVVAEGAVVTGAPDPAFFSVVVDVAAELPG
jgi:hypothetical protein